MNNCKIRDVALLLLLLLIVVELVMRGRSELVSPGCSSNDELSDLRSTATLIRGALDRVERHLRGNSDYDDQPGSSSRAVSLSRNLPPQAPRNEVQRIFAPYQPDLSVRGRVGVSKGKGSKSKAICQQQPWKKDTICLRLKDQEKCPDTREKMVLAELGLGLKTLTFALNGDAAHIHQVLIQSYESLSACGGYTMMRLATNSTDLLSIGTPKTGMTVKYLKDVLKSAKLFVRPLQKDLDLIEEEADVSGEKVS